MLPSHSIVLFNTQEPGVFSNEYGLVSLTQSVNLKIQSSIFMQINLFVFIWGYFTGKDSIEKKVSNVFLEEMALTLVPFFTANLSKESFLVCRGHFHQPWPPCAYICSLLFSTPITYCHRQTEHSTKPSGQKKQRQRALLGEMNFQPHPWLLKD